MKESSDSFFSDDIRVDFDIESADTENPPELPSQEYLFKKHIFPWEDYSKTIAQAFLETFIGVLFQPKKFFTEHRQGNGAWRACIFALITIATVFVLGIGINFATGRPLMNLGGGSLYAIALLFLSLPVIVPIIFIVGSLYLYVCLMIFNSAKAGYGATFRVTTYASAAVIFELIPYVGPIISSTWGFAATIIGLSKVHDVSIGKVISAILVTSIVFPLISYLLLWVIM